MLSTVLYCFNKLPFNLLHSFLSNDFLPASFRSMLNSEWRREWQGQFICQKIRKNYTILTTHMLIQSYWPKLSYESIQNFIINEHFLGTILASFIPSKCFLFNEFWDNYITHVFPKIALDFIYNTTVVLNMRLLSYIWKFFLYYFLIHS